LYFQTISSKLTAQRIAPEPVADLSRSSPPKKETGGRSQEKQRGSNSKPQFNGSQHEVVSVAEVVAEVHATGSPLPAIIKPEPLESDDQLDFTEASSDVAATGSGGAMGGACGTRADTWLGKVLTKHYVKLSDISFNVFCSQTRSRGFKLKVNLSLD